MLLHLLRDRVAAAAPLGKDAVSRELAAAGRHLNVDLSARVVATLSLFPGKSLFRQCAVDAAAWAGFVASDDPNWPSDATQYLGSQNRRHIQPHYGSGRFGQRDLMSYLDTWCAVLGDISGDAPSAGASASELVTFYRAARGAIGALEERHLRVQVGVWSFHGAFKIFLLHEYRLWNDPSVDEVVLPMGGESPRSRERIAGYSFEAGWDVLVGLKLVEPLPAIRNPRFLAATRRTELAHAEVAQMALSIGERALHLNTGIYCLGSPDFVAPAST